MVLAYHVIFCAYGFWLPNDPRGSWSDWIRQWELLRFGLATKVTTSRSLAARPHDHELRNEAKRALRYPPVMFDGRQARTIAMGFKRATEESGYLAHACSVLPEHVHMVIGRHEHRVEQMANHLKGAATKQLRADGLDPMAQYAAELSPWARSCWKVFLNNVTDIERATAYVNDNPIKEGKRQQHWSFVVPHTTWNVGLPV